VIHDSSELLTAIRGSGVPVVQTSALDIYDLGQEGRAYEVAGAPIQIFEFQTAQERIAVSEKISDHPNLPVKPEGSEPVIWASERLIVIHPGTDGGLILLISGLLGDPITRDPVAVDEPYPPAVLVALQDAADRSGVDPTMIQVLGFDEQDWSNSCLGLAEPDEVCVQIIVPGWRVELVVEECMMVYRTDGSGELIRLESLSEDNPECSR
jgi:hypothetical protein